MASIEEILADLETSDDTEDQGEDTTDVQTGSDNSTIKSIREAQKKSEKQARELGKALKAAQTELQEIKDAARASTVKGVFAELELPEKQADLFLKNHEGEVTADAIRQFVQDYGLKDLSGETGGTTEDKSQGFQPGGIGSTDRSSFGSKMPRAEWLQLVDSDPERAQKLHAEGRVDMSDVGFAPQ